MKSLISLFYILILLGTICQSCTPGNHESVIRSPDGSITVSFILHEGVPFYSIIRKGECLINDSRLGFVFRNLEPLNEDLNFLGTEKTDHYETWEQVWGEKRYIENNYNQMIIHLQGDHGKGTKMDLVFRAFDDGVGFRYTIPDQENLDSIIIMKELTEFCFPENCKAWWIPHSGKENSYYESLYRNSAINTLSDTIHTPVTLETTHGSFISLHEANLTDYAAMTLYRKDSLTLVCNLVPWSDGVSVYTKAPLESPWRTIRMADDPGGLITNYLELNLNEPCCLEDISWIKPQKYIGIWWGMHMGLYTWHMGPDHGATTANVLRYIKFAAENGFDGVLSEGWNKGWEFNWADHGEKFSFTESYPDFNLDKICSYAAEMNVSWIGHHETGGSVINYENQMDSAFSLCRENGVHAVKTGYVGRLLDGREWHDGQYGVNHYRRVIETAAKYQVMIDCHEPVKPTGIQRTFPNLMTQEGGRGQEYNAWSDDGGNPPEHTTILPFTRLLAGPFDYTPGIFNFKNTAKPGTRVQSTLANQLALYVILYSPFQMACDLPENYNISIPFDFIKLVPVNWSETLVLNSAIGDYVTIVRKDRNSEDWFLGSITDENSRTLKTGLSFLTPGVTYKARIYSDGLSADYRTCPVDFEYREIDVSCLDTLDLKLAPGGGQAVFFHSADTK